jgi:hypothetical protein
MKINFCSPIKHNFPQCAWQQSLKTLKRNTEGENQTILTQNSIHKTVICLLYPYFYSASLTHGAEKLPIMHLLKNFPAFYGTRRFIAVFTRAIHWSLSWARWIQFIPSHPILLFTSFLHLLFLSSPKSFYASSRHLDKLFTFIFYHLTCLRNS